MRAIRLAQWLYSLLAHHDVGLSSGKLRKRGIAINQSVTSPPSLTRPICGDCKVEMVRSLAIQYTVAYPLIRVFFSRASLLLLWLAIAINYTQPTRHEIFSFCYTLAIQAIFTIVGGIIGFTKTGSIPSLTAGVIHLSFHLSLGSHLYRPLQASHIQLDGTRSGPEDHTGIESHSVNIL